jgi:hypothetical protein
VVKSAVLTWRYAHLGWELHRQPDIADSEAVRAGRRLGSSATQAGCSARRTIASAVASPSTNETWLMRAPDCWPRPEAKALLVAPLSNQKLLIAITGSTNTLPAIDGTVTVNENLPSSGQPLD